MDSVKSWRKDIEGLRGIAVLLVVANHLGIGLFQGGFVGVDVFFVISGFVITQQMIYEYRASSKKNNGFGRISIIGFYLRRIRRIIPASFFVTASVILLEYIASNVLKATQNAVEGLWAFSFLMNWHLIFQSLDYFHLGKTPSNFIHFWSLAVEEQYYLLAPIAFAEL